MRLPAKTHSRKRQRLLGGTLPIVPPPAEAAVACFCLFCLVLGIGFRVGVLETYMQRRVIALLWDFRSIVNSTAYYIRQGRALEALCCPATTARYTYGYDEQYNWGHYHIIVVFVVW